MENAIHKNADSARKASDFLGGACLAFAGFGLFMLLSSLMFSLGPLITTGGRAWEHDPVRELLIASAAIFVLLVVLPLVAAYSLLRKGRWAKAPVTMAAIISSLVGILFVITAISLGWAGSIIISVPCFAFSGYALWSLRRKGAV